MTEQPSLLADTATDETDHWPRPQELELLGRLAEIGLNIALAVERQATGQLAEGEPPVAADVSLAYERVAKAVRLTILLQSKVIADLRHREAMAAHQRRRDEPLEEAARQARKAAGRERIEWIVARGIETEHDDNETIDRLYQEAVERLDDEDLYGTVLTRPVSEILADICRDLGLSPDWPSLAEEAWAREEIRSGKVGWPLATCQPPTEPQTPSAAADPPSPDGQPPTPAPAAPGPAHPAADPPSAHGRESALPP
jgi:hypothetical protein